MKVCRLHGSEAEGRGLEGALVEAWEGAGREVTTATDLEVPLSGERLMPLSNR